MKKSVIQALSVCLVMVAACTPPAAEPARAPLAAPISPPVKQSLAGTERDSEAGTAIKLAAEDRQTAPIREVFRLGEPTGIPLVRGKSTSSISPEGDITLNFANTDVHEVVKTVLGDFLGANYVIDPAVQGTVNIQTTRPLTRDAAVSALTAALKVAGVALVPVDGIYHVVPVQQAATQGEAFGSYVHSPGFRLDIVPLHYVGVADMQQILEPMTSPGTVLRADTGRNFLVLGGTEEELSSLINTIGIFDVDQMAGKSIGLYSLKDASAKVVLGEINQILDAESGQAGLVRLQSVDRLNAILAVSAQPAYLAHVESLINRLDRSVEGTERRLYVYRVQNGKASDLASVLMRALTGNDSGANQAGSSAPASAHTQVTYTPITTLGGASATNPSGSSFGAGIAAVPTQPSAQGASVSPSSAAPDQAHANTLRITADENNNALLVMATSSEYAIVQAALRKLDVMPLQVLIEASILEVSLTNDLQYGVEYFLKTGRHTILNTTSNTASISPNVPGFSYLYSSGANFQAIVNLLESVTTVNVLSSPELMVLNNQTAALQVGDQVPIATQSAASVLTPGAPIVNTIELHDTGVILKVTPRVNAGGLVLMDISQEVSAVAKTTSSGIDSPTIQQRRINSSVAIESGQTVALGGLITSGRTKTRSQIPLLGDIPYVGALFGTTDDSGSRTELIVLITPRVAHDTKDALDATDELRRKVPLTWGLGQAAH